MAEALHAGAEGFDTYGYDVRPIAEFPTFKDRMLPSLTNLESNDILVLVVRNQEQISELCFDNPGIYNNKKDDYPKLLVVSSTVSPRYITWLQEELPDDVSLVDAPMSGAPIAARDRSLTFMVGGDTGATDRLKPAFDVMGNNSFFLGATGQGMLAKVLNNYIAACNVISVRKSLAHAAALGMTSDTLLAVVNKSSGANWFSSNLDRIDWCAEEYEPGNTIGILEKDVTAALDVVNGLYTEGEVETLPTDTGFDDFGQNLLSALHLLPAMPSNND